MQGFQECGRSTNISYWLLHFLYRTMSDPPVLIKGPSRVKLTDKFHLGRGCGGGAFYCCCSVTQSCLTLCNPMDCSTPGLSVPHHLPKFAQIYVHCIGDAIQPSHPLRPSSLLPSFFPSIRDFSNELAVCINDQNTGVSTSATFEQVFRVDFP